MDHIKQSLQRRIADYLRYTRYARWAVILIVLTSLWVFPNLPVLPILGIASGAIVYTLVCLFGERRQWTLFTNRPLILLIDMLSAVALVVITGGQSSVYIPILLFMVVSGAYWYGSSVAILIVLVEGVLEAVGSEIIHGSYILDWSFILRLLIFATVGLYLSWLTQSERTERNELLTISSETEEQRQQLISLVNTITDAVFVSDTNGKIVLKNTATENIIDPSRMTKDAYVDGLMKFTDESGKTVRISLKNLDSVHERKDLKLVITDGSTINAQLTITPYITDGKDKGFIFIIRDITREHSIEQERLEFIAVAQHELRTPLTVAEGSLSTLMSPEYKPTEPFANEMLEMAFRSLRQLSHIVTDLTTLSQAQSEQLDTSVESVDVAEIFDDLIKEHSDEAKKKNINLDVSVPEKLQPVITSRYLVYEILSNFLTNALKFTEKGSVTLIAKPRGEKGGVALSVKDTGRGISSGDQKKLFTQFFQSENWQTRNHGGTGLGLYISKKLAKRLTAEVTFQSRLGKGSTFTLELPAFSQHASDQTKVAQAETKDFFKYL